MDQDPPSSWLSFLITTLSPKASSSSLSLAPCTLPSLPLTLLQHILTYCPPPATLSLASTCSHLTVSLLTSYPLFDQLHYQAFSTYLPPHLLPLATTGAAKSEFFSRLGRATNFRNSRVPRLRRTGKRTLATRAASAPSAGDKLPSIGNAPASGATSGNAFCTVLCPPPPFDKFGASPATGRKPEVDWTLFVGDGGGRVSAYTISLGDSGGIDGPLAVPPRQLSPPLPDNVLSLSLSPCGAFLFAGGDSPLIRCYSTRPSPDGSFAHFDEVSAGTTAAARQLQEGSLSAYSLLHRCTSPPSSSPSGNLLVGNFNSSVLVYDLHAAATSAILLPPDSDSYRGTCRGVALVEIGGREAVVALAHGGSSLCVYSAEGIFDAAPEVPDSVVVRRPVKEFSAELGSPAAFLEPLPPAGGGWAGVAVGSAAAPSCQVHSFFQDGDAPMERRAATLDWSDAGDSYLDLDGGEGGGGLLEGGSASGVSSIAVFGGCLVVGSVDGRIRVFRDLKSVMSDDGRDGPDTTAGAGEVGGICPVQGLHVVGGVGEDLALVSVGWDRTVGIWGGGNEEGGVEGGEGGTGDGVEDIIDMYASLDVGGGGEGEGDLDEDEVGGAGLSDSLLADYDAYDDDGEEEEEGEAEEEGEGGGGEAGWREAQLTDRSNFSVDEAKAEINKILEATGGEAEAGAEGSVPKENRDWRSAMRAMDDYLSHN